MTPSPIPRIDLELDEIQALLERARASMDPDDYAKLKALVETAVYLLEVMEDKRTTIDRLRKLLFGARTEKTRDVLATPGTEAASPGAAPDGQESSGPAAPPPESPPPPSGHGRHGAGAYGGAKRIPVPHAFLKPGDRCPHCQKGKVYELAQPGVLVRVVGQAPVQAMVYELQKLRCNLCGQMFTADAPTGVGAEKYDATAASMIALLKYGSGLPFNRLAGLQGNLGLPLPASTQWDIVRDTARRIEPIYAELIQQAAQGEVLHNDDTTVKILELMGKRAARAAADGEVSGRRGMFTSGIVSTRAGRRIALFFTGRRHAGENLAEVLAHRAAEWGPPIQMCDALSRNRPSPGGERSASDSAPVALRVEDLPAPLQTILAHCLAHGRRQFVDVAERFPEECRYVLETLAAVYRNDALARQRNLSAEERLHFHQAESGPLLEQLQAWGTRQFEERLVEPNSGLGEAIAYLLKHWEPLTVFLRRPGAPLDNNVCERALKKAILHRKNALFYKTLSGAHVGDVFMSLIYTSQLCGADPFDYLTVLQRHAAALASQPEQWMPWNYRETLATAAPSDPAR